MTLNKSFGNWLLSTNVMTVVRIGLIVMVVYPLLVFSSPPVDSTTPSKNLHYASYLFRQSVRIEAKCTDEGWINSNLDNPSCYKHFNDMKTFHEADWSCDLKNAHLAVAENREELHFLLRNKWPTEISDIWIGYQYKLYGRGSNWTDVYQSHMLDPDITAMLETFYEDGIRSEYGSLLKANITNAAKLCAYMKVVNDFSGVGLSSCQIPMGYLCQKDVEYVCYDGANQVYKAGEEFSPGKDVCTSCTCGQSITCLSAMCAQPTCEQFLPDDKECCKYTCINVKPEIESDMQWMLTMVFSFFILGVVLIMIYRMRQKRMAYLRFRREQLQQLRQVNFDPSLHPGCDDECDAGFHEPPPPYTFFKDGHALPPPYEQLTIPMPTVNTNNRKVEDTGEMVTLLGDSEPSTPSVQSADITLSTTVDQNDSILEQCNHRSSSLGDDSVSTTPTDSLTSQNCNSSTSTIFQTSV